MNGNVVGDNTNHGSKEEDNFIAHTDTNNGA
jgi:hypothetical protein